MPKELDTAGQIIAPARGDFMARYIVRQTILDNGKFVSTVSLGNYWRLGQEVFETMVFPSENDMGEEFCERTTAKHEALAVHARCVEEFSQVPGEQPGNQSSTTTQQEGIKMPQNMTAKIAMKVLKSELAKTKREFANLRLLSVRLSRVSGDTSGDSDLDEAQKRVEEAYQYALASLTLSRASGKSAVKECERQGLTIGNTGDTVTTPEPETAPEPYNGDDDDGDDY